MTFQWEPYSAEWQYQHTSIIHHMSQLSVAVSRTWSYSVCCVDVVCRSDSGSCSSQTSNLSSLTKSSGICQSQSPGSAAALSDAVSSCYISQSIILLLAVCHVCLHYIETRGQSNLTKSASQGAHSPVRGHPRGSKVVPLNSWGRVSY